MENLPEQVKIKLKNAVGGMIYGYCLAAAKCPEPDSCLDRFTIAFNVLMESKYDFRDSTLDDEDYARYSRNLYYYFTAKATSDPVFNQITKREFTESPFKVAKDIYDMMPFPSDGCLMPLWGILYLSNVRPGEIYPQFYREVRQLCRLTHYHVHCVISQWCLCYFIQQILYHTVMDNEAALVNLKKNCAKTIRLLSQTITDNAEFSWNEFLEACNTHPKTLKGTDKDNVYSTLMYMFWMVDLIAEYIKSPQCLESNINYLKVVEKVANYNHVTAPIIGSILGAYLGYDKLISQVNDSELLNRIHMTFIPHNFDNFCKKIMP